MKTYLVPVDFSATSIHAAEYAATLSKQTDVKKIILLHSYYISVYQSVLPTPDMVIITEDVIEDETNTKTKELEQLSSKILKVARQGVEVEAKISRLALTRAVLETIYDEKADLVLLGSNGLNSESNSHVGINAINIS